MRPARARARRRPSPVSRSRSSSTAARVRATWASCSTSSFFGPRPGRARRRRGAARARGAASSAPRRSATAHALRHRGHRRGPDAGARVHCVTALHACDTATDDALVLACATRRSRRRRAVLPGGGRAAARDAARADPAAPRCSSTPPPARVRLAPHQRRPRARARGARLPGHRDRARRLGALAQERAHPRQEGARRVPGRDSRLDALLGGPVRPKLVRELTPSSPATARALPAAMPLCFRGKPLVCTTIVRTLERTGMPAADRGRRDALRSRWRAGAVVARRPGRGRPPP